MSQICIYTVADKTKHYLFKSEAIKIFPCAYRNPVKDPEARASTEFTMSNKYAKLSPRTDSYIIDLLCKQDKTYTINFLIKGYYCEVTGLSTDDLDLLSTKLLKISLKDIDYYGDDTTSLKCTTKIIDNLVDTTAATLDNEFSISGSSTSVFCGLELVNTTDSMNYPLLARKNIGTEDTPSYTYYPNPAALPITSSLRPGTGIHSVTLIADNEQSLGATGTATKSATASGNHSISLGYHTEVSGNNSAAFGCETKATGDEQLVFGKFNRADANKVLVIGNGTSSDRKNMVEISKNGQVNLQNNTNNVINLGGNTENLGSGALNIYGSEADKVFEVTNSGKVTFVDDLTITKNNENKFKVAATDGATEIAGDLKIATDKFKVTATNGQTDIKGDLNINDTQFNVTAADGNVNAEGTLAVGKKVTIKSKGLEIQAAGTIVTKDGDTQLFEVDNTGNVTTANKLTVSNNGASITGNTSITGDTTVTGTTTSTGKLTVSSNGADITGNVDIKDGALTAAKKLTVITGGAEIKDSQTTTEDGTATTTKVETLIDTSDKTIYLKTEKTINNGDPIKCELELTDTAINLKGNTKVTGTFEATGATTVANFTEATKTIDTKGNPVYSGALIVNGGTVIKGNLIADKNLTVNGTTAFNGNVTLSNSKLTTKELAVKDKIVGNLVINDGKNDALKIEASDTGSTYGNIITKGNIVLTTDLSKTTKTKTTKTEESNIQVIIGKDSWTESTTKTTGNIWARDGIWANKLVIQEEIHAANANFKVEGGTGAITCNNITANGSLTLKGSKQSGDTTTEVTAELTLDTTNSILQISKGLDINGAVKASGKLEITNTDTSSIGGALTVGGALTINGDLSGVKKLNAETVNTLSDIRKKTNIESFIPSKSILELDVKKFEYHEDPSHKQYIGCIAQDLQEICPEIVDTNADGYLSIQESKLVYLLLDEVKKLRNEIVLLKKEK